MAITIGKKGAPSKPKATITTEIKEGKKTVSESKVEEAVTGSPSSAEGDKLVAGVPWARVGFEVGYTHNLGNYQSARIGIFLELPCQHAEVDAVADWAEGWVNKRMEKAMADLTGSGE